MIVSMKSLMSRRRRLRVVPQRLFPVALGLLVLTTILAPPRALGDVLPVSTVRVEALSTYRIQRVYAGELHHARSSRLGFEFGGIVAAVNVEEGETVSAGEEIARLASETVEANLRAARASLETARANVLAHKAQIELSAATLRRYQDLVARGHGSQQELDERSMQHRVDVAREQVLAAQLESAAASVAVAEANLDKFRIVAPYDGVVQARLVDEGSIVSPGQNVVSIVESGRLEARIGLPESMVTYLDRDTIYDMRTGNRQVQARLTGILPVADSATGTVTAIFTTDQPGLFAGTLAELSLSVDVPGQGFWVPVAALSESQRGLWSVLVVSGGDDRRFVEARLVEVLYRGRDRVFVQGTLDDGELVVAGGTSRIVPGQDVRVAVIDGRSSSR